jgi:hypothetical protein
MVDEMSKKKQIRDDFRNAVFTRDNHQCVMCGKKGNIDAHHIQDRHLLPNGGYVLENGITLCAGDGRDNCHWKAELYHSTAMSYPGYSPTDLYNKINSSIDLALEASMKLGEDNV